MVVLCVTAEPVEYSILSQVNFFTPPAIGFGSSGGELNGTVRMDEQGDYKLFVVNETSYFDWQSVAGADSTGMRYNGSFVIRVPFARHAPYNIDIPANPIPLRYYVFLEFDSPPPGDGGVYSGALLVDYRQADGNRLSYELIKLSNGISILINLLIFFIIFYIFNLFSKFSKLCLLFLSILIYSVVFLFTWADSLDTEAVEGTRFSLIPSVMQKGFDILEVAIYLVTALGLGTTRPSISQSEFQWILLGSLISIIFGLLEISCGEDNQESCSGYTSTRMVIHLFGFLTTIVAFNYHIAYLLVALSESSIAQLETGRLYQKLEKYSNFRLIFFFFILQPTVTVLIKSNLLDWVDDHLFITIFWSSKILLIAALAVAFLPKRPNLKLVQIAFNERQRERNSSGIDR